MTKRKSSNPNGRPTLDGATEMVSRRIPIALMNKVRERSENTTAFIISAIKEKIEREPFTSLTAEHIAKTAEIFANAGVAANQIANANKKLANLSRKSLEEFIKSK